MEWERDAPKRKTSKPSEKPPRDEHRLEARRFFRAAPPYCVRFEDDGQVTLRRKVYEYDGVGAPEAATTWQVLSTHPSLDEAERRLRLICGPTIYYGADGQPTRAPMKEPPRWGMPPTDGEDEVD